MSFQVASSSPSSAARLVLPAQLTRMSTLPNAASVASQQRLQRVALGDVGGQRAASCAPPPRSRPLSRRPRRPRRAAATTSAPAAASPRLIARPIPDVPPRTTAVRPSRLNAPLTDARPGHGAEIVPPHARGLGDQRWPCEWGPGPGRAGGGAGRACGAIHGRGAGALPRQPGCPGAGADEPRQAGWPAAGGGPPRQPDCAGAGGGEPRQPGAARPGAVRGWPAQPTGR